MFENSADQSFDFMAKSNRILEKKGIVYSFINCTCHQILLELWKEERMNVTCNMCTGLSELHNVTCNMCTGLSELHNVMCVQGYQNYIM